MWFEFMHDKFELLALTPPSIQGLQVANPSANLPRHLTSWTESEFWLDHNHISAEVAAETHQLFVCQAWENHNIGKDMHTISTTSEGKLKVERPGEDVEA